MAPRQLLVAAAMVSGLLVAGPAHAWQEAHQAGDDVRVRVDPAGTARVEHHLKWRVVRGPLKWVDLMGVDPLASVEPDVTITAEDGRALTGHAARHDDRTVRVTVDEPRALMRGTFDLEVRWQIDLAASHVLTRDGATWRLGWSAPVASDGFDSAKTILELPEAPDPPAPIVAETGAVDDAAVVALRRESGADVLELVRPHVARGEAPVWTVRIDPRALPLVIAPALRRPSEVRASAEPDRVSEASALAGLLGVALGFGLLVRRKSRSFGAACATAGAVSRGLLPLSEAWRPVVAGAALAGAIGLEVRGEPTVGAVLVVLATLAASLRAPAGRVAVRGPGRWLALSPGEAFARPPRNRREPLAWLALVSALVAAALVAQRLDPRGPWLVAIDAVALVPLWMTGRRSQLPPDGASAGTPQLRRMFRALERVSALRVCPWGRIPLDRAKPDELRVLVLPRAAMPGLVGVEIGLAWSDTPVGWTASPEVLARVLDGSPAAIRLTRALPSSRAVPGRRPEERVLRLVPRSPGSRSTVALAKALGEMLTDRRAEATRFAGVERRAPAPARVPAPEPRVQAA